MNTGTTAGVPEPLDLFGVGVTPFVSYGQAVDCVGRLIDDGRQACCVAVNPEKIHRAGSDPELAARLAGFEMAICDGMGAKIAVRLLHGRSIPRITGIALFLSLLEAAGRRGWPVFLLGASEEVNRRAAAVATERYPGLEVAGRCNGYFSDTAAVVEQVNGSGARVLFAALGSPTQEEWITTHRRLLAPRFLMGVGGSFDVLAGRVPRAPRPFRATGMEFLYRLLLEPQRCRRQSVLPRFALQVLRRWLFSRRR